jgi:hypothetical protein
MPVAEGIRSRMALSSAQARNSSLRPTKKADQSPPNFPTPLASFNITQLGLAHDKIDKDTNFRGLT